MAEVCPAGGMGDAEERDWCNGLPSVILCSIFDIILTAPSAHPSYLVGKVKSAASLARVCKSWKSALHETPIGVCLPAEVSLPMRRWLVSVTLRGIEFHDPEHTQPEVVALLSDPQLIARSGRSCLSIVDAPFDGSWRPADFPHLVQLVVWRAGRASALWDVRVMGSLQQLTYLVLASGFSGMKHMEAWPPGCKRLVWTCPSDSHSSRLSMPALPPNVSLQWVSLRAYAVRLHNLEALLGRVAELVVHAAYLFVRVPRQRYRSLYTPPAPPPSRTGSSGVAGGNPSTQPTTDPASISSLAQQAVAAARAARGGGAAPGAALIRDTDWAEEGLAAMASMFVEEPSLLNLRLKFARLLVSQPLTGWLAGLLPEGVTLPGTPPDGGPGDGGAGSRAVPTRPPPMCHSCGRPRVQPSGRTTARGKQPRGADAHPGDSSDGEEDDMDEGESEESDTIEDEEEEEAEEMVYDEVTPDQVTAAFQVAIKAYAEVVAVRSRHRRDSTAPPAPLPALPRVGGIRGRGEHVEAAGPPADLSMVVPLLETGKPHPGQDREVSITRKHADPSEPARIKLDQPTHPGGPRLSEQFPTLLRSKRPVQCLVFAPWPYAATDGMAAGDEEEEGGDARTSGASGAGGAAVAGSAHGDGDTVMGGGGDTAGVEAAAEGSSGAGAAAVEPGPLTVRRASRLQHALLTDPRFQAASAEVLRKINWALLPPWLLATGARDMFAPYTALTKVSLVVLGDSGELTTPILPVSVVKVQVTAGAPHARFHSGCVSNLTEMWRLTLSGFESLDLSAMPAVRPGFVLKLVDTPGSRPQPLGHPSRDILMPQGRIVDMNVQIGTDTSVSDMNAPIARVHLGAWAPLCRDLHVRCPPGAELHTDATTLLGLFAHLSRCRVEQFTVCLATGPSGDVVAGPAPVLMTGGGRLPVFAFVSPSGARMHGVTLAMMVREGLVPEWQVEIMDAGAVEDEEGMLYFTFFKKTAFPEAPGQPPGMTGGAAPPLPPPPAAPHAVQPPPPPPASSPAPHQMIASLALQVQGSAPQGGGGGSSGSSMLDDLD